MNMSILPSGSYAIFPESGAPSPVGHRIAEGRDARFLRSRRKDSVACSSTKQVRAEMMSHARREKAGPALQDLRGLRSPLRLAQKVGEGLVGGSILQRAVPPRADKSLRSRVMEQFPSDRQSALLRLDEFVHSGAAAYARTRNFVQAGHDNVSRLSAALRHRLISEEEVLEAVLTKHRFSAVEKFVQEVVWRTYWKGWLELHPGVWTDFTRLAAAATPEVPADTTMDFFTEELRSTGYMHNHARMWWAAWWCHQRGLPWAAGARFFYDHLLDADAASNTLGWRWVAGLQTPGKTYLARRDNLAKYWKDHRSLEGIYEHVRARIPTETADRSRIALPEYPEAPVVGGKVALLGHPDDLSIENTPLGSVRPAALALVDQPGEGDSAAKIAWRSRATNDAVARWTAHYGVTVTRLSRWDGVLSWMATSGCEALVLVAPFVGRDGDAWQQARQTLQGSGTCVMECRRGWDTRMFPAARAGFFPFWHKASKAVVQRYL